MHMHAVVTFTINTQELHRRLPNPTHSYIRPKAECAYVGRKGQSFSSGQFDGPEKYLLMHLRHE